MQINNKKEMGIILYNCSYYIIAKLQTFSTVVSQTFRQILQRPSNYVAIVLVCSKEV